MVMPRGDRWYRSLFRPGPDQIAGAREVLENGGEVRVLSFRDGHSTSRIIDKLDHE